MEGSLAQVTFLFLFMRQWLSVLLKAFSGTGQVQPHKRLLKKMHTLPYPSYVQVLQRTASLQR